MRNLSISKKLMFALPHPLLFYTYKFFCRRKFKGGQKRRTKIALDNENSLNGFDRYRCIFIHIPKAGGVSLASELFGNLGGGHQAIYSYYLVYSPKEFNEYYKFSIVRNPWDRIVSAYFFLKEGGFHEYDRSWFIKNLSMFTDFEDFILHWVTKKNVNSYMHFIPQFEFLTLGGNLLVDKVYKIEEMTSVIEDLNGKLGAKLCGHKKNTTKGRKSNYRVYYSDETRKIVADVYKKDIQIFNYTF
ncbi:sulfotransferase family 2 domain-containing protein [Desulfobacterota bacterium M19]